MSYFEGLILGLIQGLTEFIPVSSSGHLVLAHDVFGPGINDLAVDAVLQMASAFAIFVYFRKDLISLVRTFFNMIFRRSVEPNQKTLVSGIILGTIPALVLGLLLEDKMGTVFRNPNLVAFMLIFGSILMACAEYLYKGIKQFSIGRGLGVGFFQALALLPGVSRSGATISGGLFFGLSREEATRFSFLLGFPIILGSGLKAGFDLWQTGFQLTGPFVFSGLIAFGSGLWAIAFLIRYLKKHTLKLFILYRIFLAGMILLLL